MTVAELINALSLQPQDADVWALGEDGLASEVIGLDLETGCEGRVPSYFVNLRVDEA
jgi:hypothetical protein